MRKEKILECVQLYKSNDLYSSKQPQVDGSKQWFSVVAFSLLHRQTKEIKQPSAVHEIELHLKYQKKIQLHKIFWEQ